jgi:hypothetical protein
VEKKRKKLLLWAKTLISKLHSGLNRFPETLLMCAVTVVVLIVYNHCNYGYTDGDTLQYLLRLAAVLALGIPLSLCIRVFYERVPDIRKLARVLIYLAVAAALVIYYFYLLPDFGMVAVTRYIAVFFALFLAFTFIPYLNRKQNYELYVIRLAVSFFVTYLFSVILFAGLSAMLATIGYLFDIKILGAFYFDIWAIVAGIFAPAFFLADIPDGDRELEHESYPPTVKSLLSYIMLPLIAAYCVILYIYFLKILVTRQWPDVMVSHLVLWYALLCTLVIFCIYPLRRLNKWTKTFSACFPLLLLPLLLLMFAAMWVRIRAYGITENRYFVLAAGIWVAGSMLYLIIAKKPKNLYLPVALALVALLSVFGPWSSYSVAMGSQNRRFEKIAAENNLLLNGEIIKPATELQAEKRRELSSIVTYFNRHYGLQHLRALPEGVETIPQVEDLLGFPLDPYAYPPDESDVYFRCFLKQEDAVWEIADFAYFMHITSVSYLSGVADNIAVSYFPQDHRLEINLAGKTVYSKNIAEIVQSLWRDNVDKAETLPREKMSYFERLGDLEVLIVFQQFSGSSNRLKDEITLHFVDFYLFINS